LEALVAALKLSGAHLIGHSIGGAVAGLVVLQEPRLVRSLTLISPAGLGQEINAKYIDGFVAAVSGHDLKPVLQYLFADAELVSRSMVGDLLRHKRLDGVQAALRGFASATFKDSTEAELGGGSRQAYASHSSRLGAEDAIIPATHAKVLPNARAEIIDAAEHMA
jgi:pyruvate dehydrogenase E2 component (dihydrolipoamide acetyltransferase)